MKGFKSVGAAPPCPPKSQTCDYTGRLCDFWEAGAPGQCLALDPEDCPANTPEDVAAIDEWRRRQCQP